MNSFRHPCCAVAALALISVEVKAQEPLTARCESAPLMATFAVFGESGLMPPDLGRLPTPRCRRSSVLQAASRLRHTSATACGFRAQPLSRAH